MSSLRGEGGVMARKAWVVERETRKRWSAYEVYLYRSWAQTNMKMLVRMYPGAKWRIVRYVPEDEK